jgi:hypothetical protein
MEGPAEGRLEVAALRVVRLPGDVAAHFLRLAPRTRTATPFHPICPFHAAPYPAASIEGGGAFNSCKHATSGFVSTVPPAPS